MYQLKKLSLYVILDAYVTKNAIEDILNDDNEEIKNSLLLKYNLKVADEKISNYINYLNRELNEIENFLSTEDNIYFQIIGKDRVFFDTNLPKYKKKIVWFHSVDRYPFDYSIFFSNE